MEKSRDLHAKPSSTRQSTAQHTSNVTEIITIIATLLIECAINPMHRQSNATQCGGMSTQCIFVLKRRGLSKANSVLDWRRAALTAMASAIVVVVRCAAQWIDGVSM